MHSRGSDNRSMSRNRRYESEHPGTGDKRRASRSPESSHASDNKRIHTGPHGRASPFGPWSGPGSGQVNYAARRTSSSNSRDHSPRSGTKEQQSSQRPEGRIQHSGHQHRTDSDSILSSRTRESKSPAIDATLDASRAIDPLTSTEDGNEALARIAGLSDMLKDFTTIIANLASCQMSCQQAEARLKRASLEYDVQKSHFQHFPPLKRIKTDAREQAQKDYDATCHLRDALAAQQKEKSADIARTIIEKQRPSAPTVTPENILQIQARLDTIENENKQLRSLLTAQNNNINTLPDSTKAIGLLQKKVDILLSRVDNGDAQARQRNMMTDHVERDVRGIKQDMLALNPMKAHVNTIQDVTSRLKTLELQQQTEKTETSGLKDKLAHDVQELRSQMNSLDTARTGASASMSSLTKVNDGLRVDIRELQLKINQIDETCAALQKLSSETRQENETRANAERSLREQLAKSIDDLGARMNQTQHREDQQDQQVQGRGQFVPVFATDHGQSMAASQEGRFAVRNEIEGLKSNVQNLSQRMNNLKTDHIVAAMADQMQTMYPDAKNFQKAVKSLRDNNDSTSHKLLSFEQQQRVSLQFVGKRISMLEASAEQAAQSRILQEQYTSELDRLRTELASFESSVSQHIASSHEQRVATQEDIKAVHADAVRALQTAQDALFSADPKND